MTRSAARAAAGQPTTIAAAGQRARTPTVPARTRRESIVLLFVIALAQMIIVLDVTIVTIALPEAQADLEIADRTLPWVVNAYSLAFGGLLLLGGRASDSLGRKRALILGMVVFAAASAFGGVARGEEELIAARALQGVAAAVIAPAALSLLTTGFTAPRERARAFAVYGAVGAGGSAVGLLLGGFLTSYFSWRWTMLVNAPLGLFTAVLAARFLRDSVGGRRVRFDVPGALLSCAGVGSLVYGCVLAEELGWTSPRAAGVLAGAFVALALFFLVEARTAQPLLPPRVLRDRARAGALAASLLAGAATLAMFYFLSLYMQRVREFSALETGLAFLPNTVTVIAFSAVAARMLLRLGARACVVSGFLLAAAGLAWLSGLGTDSSYVGHILPAGLVLCIGLPLVLVPLASAALVHVAPEDAGVASALLNVTQQIGGSLGLAVLASVAAQRAASVTGSQEAALVSGYGMALAAGAGIMIVGAIVAAATLRVSQAELPHDDVPAVALV